MTIVQIIQLAVLIWGLLKEMESEEPSGDKVKNSLLEIVTVLDGNEETIAAITSLPAKLLADVAKLLSGE
jgi:hypothetical protein